MITQNNLNYWYNIALHVFLLFTFLTLFFFNYISKIEKKSINSSISKIIKEQTKDALEQINEWNDKTKSNLDWNSVNKVAQNIIDNSKDDASFIEKNNKKLFKSSIIFISILFGILISVYLYFTLFTNLKINLREIILENIIIFAIVGIIEVYFFLNIVSNYIPVTPSFMTKSIVKNIKEKLNTILS